MKVSSQRNTVSPPHNAKDGTLQYAIFPPLIMGNISELVSYSHIKMEINGKSFSNARNLSISVRVVSKAMKNNFQFIVNGDAGSKSFQRKATSPPHFIGAACLIIISIKGFISPPSPPHTAISFTGRFTAWLRDCSTHLPKCVGARDPAIVTLGTASGTGVRSGSWTHRQAECRSVGVS
jgi:hypothetical protein